MKHALAFSLSLTLAACAANQAQVAPEQAPLWRYRMKPQPDGTRVAVAVDERSGREEALPQDLWCPHGAIVELEWDAQGKVVGVISREEPVEVKVVGHAMAQAKDGGLCMAMLDVQDGVSGRSAAIGVAAAIPKVRPFVLAPATDQREPWVVLRFSVDEGQAYFSLLERRLEGLRVTPLGPWQIEHIQFQRMERPGPGLENCVLFTFQAGEGSQVCVVKVEVGEQGARLRPRTDGDAAILRHFLGRATPAEKAVVEKILAP